MDAVIKNRTRTDICEYVLRHSQDKEHTNACNCSTTILSINMITYTPNMVIEGSTYLSVVEYLNTYAPK